MPHWRRPLYRIETEYGVLYSVDEDKAHLFATEMMRDPEPVKFRVVRAYPPISGFCIPITALAISVIIGGLYYLFGG